LRFLTLRLLLLLLLLLLPAKHAPVLMEPPLIQRRWLQLLLLQPCQMLLHAGEH
jgi:hypothetical protein